MLVFDMSEKELKKILKDNEKKAKKNKEGFMAALKELEKGF